MIGNLLAQKPEPLVHRLGRPAGRGLCQYRVGDCNLTLPLHRARHVAGFLRIGLRGVGRLPCEAQRRGSVQRIGEVAFVVDGPEPGECSVQTIQPWMSCFSQFGKRLKGIGERSLALAQLLGD